MVEESETENHSTVTETAPGVHLDSDLESGPLVIDEGDKKKTLKRKSVLGTPLNTVRQLIVILFWKFCRGIYLLWHY